jgi:hypothetical protein
VEEEAERVAEWRRADRAVLARSRSGDIGRTEDSGGGALAARRAVRGLQGRVQMLETRVKAVEAVIHKGGGTDALISSIPGADNSPPERGRWRNAAEVAIQRRVDAGGLSAAAKGGAEGRPTSSRLVAPTPVDKGRWK